MGSDRPPTIKKAAEMDGGEPPPTLPNRWGYPVRTASAACIAAVDSYYEEVLTYGRNRAVILQATAHDSECVLAATLAAHFLWSKNPSKATSFLAAAASGLESATAYERAVHGAISCLVGHGRDEDAAVECHSKLLKEYPKDLASLKRVQILCFYMGQPDLFLNLVEQVLPENQGQSYIYGMLAFPLLELGRMSEAESAARKGLKINKNDIWSQHNLCHVLQYECRFKEAVKFMEACSSSWHSCCSFMYTHNWWHVAVCYLEGHSPLHKVLEVYDQYIWKELEREDAECGEVYINALGLLLRVSVRGQMSCIEDRLMVLANIFRDEGTWHMEWLLDILGLWALSQAEETHKAEDLFNSMKSRFHMMSKKKQNSFQMGLLGCDDSLLNQVQLAEAIYEYGRSNYHKVFDILGPDFDAINCKMIGASDEQLDVFNEIWCDVLLRTGHVSLAVEVIEKQVTNRDGDPFLWRMLEKAYSIEGRADASSAMEKAKFLEAAYFK